VQHGDVPPTMPSGGPLIQSNRSLFMAETWLKTLRTVGPQEGYELAIKLSRMAVKYTQPSEDMRARLRPPYAENADSLIAVSHVVATYFDTVAAANDYWSESR
jgi:hypothetical protein